MVTTIDTVTRDAQANAAVDLLDVGTTNPEGRLIIQTAGDVEVATLPMSNPAFGNAATGVCTANAITDDASATGGTAANFILVDRDGNERMRGLVATSGAELNLSSVTIGASDTVSVSALTYTVPATDA